MGYMEGNLSGMDYSYGGGASHYPLWKPPSGYFPRGEAPPPYEEAVAISQAEALSAQCTVSVATTTHRAVDISGELRRGNQLQQQQQQALPQQQQQSFGQLAQQQAMQTTVGTIPHHHHQQQNQITQSTTNLINININSGGNVTTIATGENHQPPYSIQNDCNGHMVHTAQEHQLQQHLHQPVVSGRLNLPPSNSICVQTMAQHQQQQQQQQITVASTPTTNAATLLQQQAPCQLLQMAECSYKNCQFNASSSGTTQRHLQRTTQDTLQQYVSVSDVDLPSTAADAAYHTLSGSNVVGGDFELIASPTQFSNNATCNSMLTAVSTPTLDVLPPTIAGEISTISSNSVSVGLNTLSSPSSRQTLNLKNNNSNTYSSSTGNKTPSSGRRYHRTIPRYFAVSDPLSANNHATPSKSLSKSIVQKKNSSIIAAATATNTAAGGGYNCTIIAAKKPTCQCPVQHVPMSYMGTNQLNINAQQHVPNNVFLSTLSHKLNSSVASSSSGSNNSGRSSLSYGHRTKPSAVSTFQQSITEANPKRSTYNSPYCNHESKISTISKQVGDSTTDIVTAGHHHHQHHQHHHHTDAPMVVLNKVPKNTGQEAQRSTGRTESNAAIFLNGKIDAFLNYPNHQHLHSDHQVNDPNPVLPPKLYKSLTNLKAVATTSNATNICISSSPPASSSTQISVSSQASSSRSNELATSTSLANASETVCSTRFSSTEPRYLCKATTTRKEDQKNTPPSFTLPPPSPSVAGVLGSAELKPNNKINSSTFYPLQNNHVTYTLPKHYSGKISLNSTIANVVSKVPSVISIPTTDSQSEEKTGCSTRNATPNKCTTLPKILRIKRVPQDSTKAVNGSVSSFVMPDYPQQHSSEMVIRSHTGTVPGTSSKTSLQKSSKDKHLPVCTTSKNCLNPKEHFLPNDTSLDDDYLSECENCKIAQSSKYYLNAEIIDPPQETMTLQRKSMDDNKEEQEQAYYRISHTLPTNPKKNAPIKNNNREPSWFSTIAASSSSEDDVNE